MTSSSRWCSARDVVAAGDDEVVASLGGQVAEGEPLGDVGDDAEVAAQIVRRLLPEARRAPFQLADVLERALEIAHRAGRLDALEAEVALRALAHRIAHCSASFIRASASTSAAQLGWPREAVELGDQAAVQRSPIRA